jgi:chorismate--pyruvate lyase
MGLHVRTARWFDHVNALGASAVEKSWLSDAGSMTQKLKSRSRHFAVRHLSQQSGQCAWEESRALGLTQRLRLKQREVILLCDNAPVIYGFTSVMSRAMRRDWPFLQRLGNVPLGAKLFTDVGVERQPLQYARLHPSHPLMRQAAKALGMACFPKALFARRSVFSRQQGVMLVTEIFLPAITQVMAIESTIDEFTF